MKAPYAGEMNGVTQYGYDERLGPSMDFIMAHYDWLRMLYSGRNAEYDTLRRVFDGDFASLQEAKAKPDALFNDRIKIVYNICNATVRRYIDSNSAPPSLTALPRGFEQKDLILADAKTHWLNHIHQANDMAIQLMMASYYQSLLDRAVWHVRPAPATKHKISIELVVPDNFLPMPPNEHWRKFPFIIYGFYKYNHKDVLANPLKQTPNSLQQNVIEFWDMVWYVRIEDGKETHRIKHDFGVDAFEMATNIPIPHRYRGQGDIDQAIGLNEYLNMMMSDLADIINYAANPIAVVRGSKAGATNLPFAPRAVWELERDGQAGFLQWSGTPPTAESQILRTIQALEDTTGVSSPAFGREIPSGTSGSAVRSLLAGFNTRLGTKQQLMGESLAKVNKVAMLMAERLFPNQEYDVIGEFPVEKEGKRIVKAKRGYTIKPKDFGGWYENEVAFDPIDPTMRFFQEMDKYDKKLQSRQTTMKNLGIKNTADEIERMRDERREDAEHENAMALGRQGVLPPAGSPIAGAGDGVMPAPGSPGVLPASPDPLALAYDKGGPEEIMRLLKIDPKAGKEGHLQKAPPDRANIQEAAAPSSITASPGQEQGVSIDDVLQRLRKGPQANGPAAISGDLLKTGATQGNIEIQLRDPSDESRIREALGSFGSKVQFKRVTGEFEGDHLPFAGDVKKKPEGARAVKADAFLNVVVMAVQPTDNGASVYTVGVFDSSQNLVPIAKTFPQRKIKAEEGELIVVHIDGVSCRESSGKMLYQLVKPQVITPKIAPTRPDSLSKIEKLYQEGQ